MTSLRLFYRGTDSRIYSRLRDDNGNWGKEELTGDELVNGNPIAARVSGTTIQLFYRNTDNRLCTRWLDNKGWSKQQVIGGILAGDPICAYIPGSKNKVLQLFYRGTNNVIYSFWRSETGSWSEEQKIGGILTGDPVSAVVPNTQVLQLFYRGTDSQIYSVWRPEGGGWSGEQKIGGLTIGNPIAVAAPADKLRLFYRGTNYRLFSMNRDADGKWSEKQLMPDVQLNSNPLAAFLPATDILLLFYQRDDSKLYCRQGDIEQGFNVIPYSSLAVAAVPGPPNLLLLYRGQDNKARSLERAYTGQWSGEKTIEGGFLGGDPVLAETDE